MTDTDTIHPYADRGTVNRYAVGPPGQDPAPINEMVPQSWAARGGRIEVTTVQIFSMDDRYFEPVGQRVSGESLKELSLVSGLNQTW
jgi:hypothetical protein